MRASADPQNKTGTVLILLLLMAGGYLFRGVFAEAVMPPPERMQGETTQAYRYTEMIAEGRDIPSLDTLVMRPEGLRTGENSIFEEYLAGGLHRLIGGDFNGFLRAFSRLFPLLLLPVLFFWMTGLGYSRSESLFGAALYGVFLPALLRTRGESLYRETVALPLILLALMLADLARGKRGREELLTATAGALMFLSALAAWKVTGFLSFLLFLWLTFSGAGKRTVLPFAFVQILASISLSHMRHDGAMFSPGTVMAAGAALHAFYSRAPVRWAALAGSLTFPFFFASRATGHVSAVIAAKLRFFFSHPQDPSLLSPDARLFWVSGYTSPSPAQITFLFGIAIILAAIGWKRFREKADGTLLFWLFPASLAGYLFFDRLHVLLAVGIIPVVVSALRGNRFLLPAAVLVFGVHSMYAPWFAGVLSEAGLEMESSGSLLNDEELDGLLEWAENSRGTVLSYWHISGLLSAYAKTPVVTHTFFENQRNRETIQEFAVNMFSPPEEMISFMDEKGAEYLVYQADFVFDRSPEGLLYLAGLTEIPEGCLAVRLHYYPESLDGLWPLWQGPSIRVFSRSPATGTVPRHALWERRYGTFLNTYEIVSAVVASPIETGLYLANAGIPADDFQRISAGLLLLSTRPDEVPGDASVELLQRLLMAHLSDDYDMEYLEEDFEAYLSAWGPDPELRLDLVRLLRNAGMDHRAEHHIGILEDMGRGNR